MDKFGNARGLLTFPGESLGSVAAGLAIAIEAPLTHDLAVTGVVDAQGQPISWVLPSGSSGLQVAPGSRGSGGGHVFYAIAKADADGRATAFWF